MHRRHVVTAVALAAAVFAGTLGALPAAAVTAGLTNVATLTGGSYNGWVLDNFATGEVWSSPAVGDVNGDGRPEVVVGGLDSTIRIYSTANWSLLARIDTGNADKANRRGAVQASPALGDMNNDGVLDIVAANTAGILATYSFKGNVVTTLSRLYAAPHFTGALEGLFSTPALNYLDGDTSLDVTTTSWGQDLKVYSGTPSVPVPSRDFWFRDTAWSSPAVGDIDGDGRLEIVSGADCDGSGPPQPCYGTTGGGYVWAMNQDGSVKWSRFIPRAVVWSTPALADLNNDGALDVVVGTGLYYNGTEARKVMAFNGRTGAPLWEAGTPGAVMGSPSVGDVNGDGKPEVFVVSRGGVLLSISGQTGLVSWTRCITDSGSCSGSEYATHGGVSLADIDGDGTVEILSQAEQKLVVLDATNGTREGAYRSTYPKTIFAGSSTPTVATVDGKATVIVTSRGDANGNGARDDNDELVVSVWQSAAALGAAPWPTFKQNMFRTGSAVSPTPPDPTATKKFVAKLYSDFLHRTAGTDEVSYWTTRLMNGQITRYQLASVLASSDEWISTVVTGFYTDTLGRQPDAAGLKGWADAARAGMPIAQIASAFYGSPEYFQNIGGNTNRTWVSDLYVKLLHRTADQGGVDGWVGALNNGMARDTLAFGFYQSAETLQIRITALYTTLLARAPENGAVANWSPFVKNNGDLVLAAALGASDEYFVKA